MTSKRKIKMNIGNLSLWYDKSQALYNINVSILENKVTLSQHGRCWHNTIKEFFTIIQNSYVLNDVFTFDLLTKIRQYR